MSALLRPVTDGEVPVDRLIADVRTPLTTPATVAVWGVKGGVGTTTVALLAGHALARHRPDDIVVGDPTPYGSLAIRAGMVLPAEPVLRPRTATAPAIAIGHADPVPSGLRLLDAPAADLEASCEVVVVSAAVDAVVMATGHGAPIVALTHLTTRTAIDTGAAISRLSDGGAEVIEIPFDAHLAVGGPLAWDRLTPATRDAARRLAAAVMTVMRDDPAPPLGSE